MRETNVAPLAGKALLQKLKELNHLNKRDRARECGYITRSRDNQERVNLTEFYEAILEARGIAVDPEQAKDGRGREPTYRISVHKNGQIVIGASYTREMGLNEGDEFEIKLGYKHIRLNQITKDAEHNGLAHEDEDV